MNHDARNLTARTLDVLEALCGYAASGATNGDLAVSVKTSPSNVTRAVAELIAKGWASKDTVTGRFFPAAAFTRLVFKVDADFERAQNRLDDRRRNATGR